MADMYPSPLPSDSLSQRLPNTRRPRIVSPLPPTRWNTTQNEEASYPSPLPPKGGTRRKRRRSISRRNKKRARKTR